MQSFIKIGPVVSENKRVIVRTVTVIYYKIGHLKIKMQFTNFYPNYWVEIKNQLHTYDTLYYKCQTYRNSHLFGKSVSPCIFLILIYTDQEHTGTHTFSKCAGKVSDLKRCEFLYVLATHVIWSGTYKNLHLFKILWKQSYQFRCESLYVPCLYI